MHIHKADGESKEFDQAHQFLFLLVDGTPWQEWRLLLVALLCANFLQLNILADVQVTFLFYLDHWCYSFTKTRFRTPYSPFSRPTYVT
jgi:hypothetical protein